MDFAIFLKDSAGKIDQFLDQYLKKWTKDLQKTHPHLTQLAKSFIQANEGGKRLRGSLVILGYQLTGSDSTPEILKPAAALELFHTGILAHDDIIDQSPLRRGKPTLYQALGGDHHGISQTICLGDEGMFLAFKLIAEANFSAEKKVKAINIFANTALRTADGEMLDVEIPHQKTKFTEEDVLTIHKLKTAQYTISGPLSIGAVLGGVEESKLAAISKFGENLGIAFQIQDDILGVFGSEEELGKSVTSDIEEGKVTLHLVYALKRASRSQKSILNNFYGKGKISQSEAERVREVFLQTGALDLSKEKVVFYTKKAQGQISRITDDPDQQRLLSSLAESLIDRRK